MTALTVVAPTDAQLGYSELPDWRETDEAARGAGGAREASEGEDA